MEYVCQWSRYNKCYLVDIHERHKHVIRVYNSSVRWHYECFVSKINIVSNNPLKVGEIFQKINYR
jgi:hypothetical protein